MVGDVEVAAGRLDRRRRRRCDGHSGRASRRRARRGSGARQQKEAHFFEELRAGRTTLQLLSLDDVADRTRDATDVVSQPTRRSVLRSVCCDLAADRVVVAASSRRTTRCRRRSPSRCTCTSYVRAFSARYLFDRIPYASAPTVASIENDVSLGRSRAAGQHRRARAGP